VPGYRSRIRDEAGQPIVEHGRIGDLYIQQALVGADVLRKGKSGRRRERRHLPGRLDAQRDKYERDADGYYVYSGRSDDMLKVSGQYVSPFEVEATLVQHPGGARAALIGLTDEHGLTRPKAYVVLKERGKAGEAMAEELKAFVKSRLATHKYPRLLEFIDELPKTATGKIQRFRCARAKRRAAEHRRPRSCARPAAARLGRVPWPGPRQNRGCATTTGCAAAGARRTTIEPE